MNRQFENQLNILREEGLLTYAVKKPLSACGTFRIGGPVDYAVYPKNGEGVRGTLLAAVHTGEPLRVVGNGSNILFPDEGWNGAILFTSCMDGVRICENKVIAGAGESFTALAVKAMKSGLSGLEFAFGIPGSVGGAVFMNAGAYEHSVSEVLLESEFYDPKSKETGRLTKERHQFSYRYSSYMENSKIILSAAFLLVPDQPENIKARMDDYAERRKNKQPLELPSAGSVFKRFPGRYTGKLIEDSGLKGYSVGGAQVSPKHAGFIVNTGGATAGDVKKLVAYIEETVYKNFGIHIERELIYF